MVAAIPTRKKSRLMREAEVRVNAPMEDYIADRLSGGFVHDGALSDLAHELDVSKATLGYWMLRLGIHLEDVAVLPGDRVYAIDRHGSERLLLEVD